MPRTIDVSEARLQLDELLQAVAAGEEIIIARDHVPLARLIAETTPCRKRKAGLGRGEIEVSDDFDAPLPDEFWLGKE